MTAESQPAVLPLNYGHHKETHYIQSKGTVANATHTYRSATVCFRMVGAQRIELYALTLFLPLHVSVVLWQLGHIASKFSLESLVLLPSL